MSLLAPGELRSRLIAHRDEERRDVLAVLSRLLEGGARAVRGDAFAAELDGRLVRLGIGTLDAPGGACVRDGDALDDAALFVVEATKEGAGAEQAAKTAVGERGESVGYRRQAALSVR